MEQESITVMIAESNIEVIVDFEALAYFRFVIWLESKCYMVRVIDIIDECGEFRLCALRVRVASERLIMDDGIAHCGANHKNTTDSTYA
ncbi:hypothetical protein Tco_1133590 [Tanacetum coccineum]